MKKIALILLTALVFSSCSQAEKKQEETNTNSGKTEIVNT
jgi:PBP1b-binding outer membrane lipoprotein LpoB